MNNLRRINRIEEFPLILGREFTGVVKAKGRFVRNLKIGDRVWGVVPPHQSGSLAEYVVVNQLTVNFTGHKKRLFKKNYYIFY